VLCDTNGGGCPTRWPTSCTRAGDQARLGIHCHNDAGARCQSLAAVDAGATHVQGTLNGHGERTGNADILTVVANLHLGPAGALGLLWEATRVTHAVPSPPTCRPTAVSRRRASAFAPRPVVEHVRVDLMLTSTRSGPSATTCGCCVRHGWPQPRSRQVAFGYDLSGNGGMLGR
jgi:hypothetical protein